MNIAIVQEVMSHPTGMNTIGEDAPDTNPGSDGSANTTGDDHEIDHLLPPHEVQLPVNIGRARRRHERSTNTHTPNTSNGPIKQVHSLERITRIPSLGSSKTLDVDRLAIDMTDPEEKESWNERHPMGEASNTNCGIIGAA